MTVDQLLLTILGALILLSSASIIVKLISENKKLTTELENREELANESYIKFLSDSRDWAYEYIESVQNSLIEFAEKVEPQLDYFEKYGKEISGPHQIIIGIIDEAYKDLLNVLPEINKEKKNNE